MEVPQLQSRREELDAAHQHRGQQTQGQPLAQDQMPHQQRRRQEAHGGFQQIVPIRRQGVTPGVHPQEDHGVIGVPAAIQQIVVENTADQRQKHQQMAVQLRRQLPMDQQQGSGEKHRHIQELSQQYAENLPQDGQHQPQGLGKAVFIGQVQKPQPVQNAVDPIGHVQPQLQNQGVKPHPAPPSGRR